MAIFPRGPLTVAKITISFFEINEWWSVVKNFDRHICLQHQASAYVYNGVGGHASVNLHIGYLPNLKRVLTLNNIVTLKSGLEVT